MPDPVERKTPPLCTERPLSGTFSSELFAVEAMEDGGSWSRIVRSLLRKVAPAIGCTVRCFLV